MFRTQKVAGPVGFEPTFSGSEGLFWGAFVKRTIKKSFIPIWASFALALNNSATSVLKHMPVIPGLGNFHPF